MVSSPPRSWSKEMKEGMPLSFTASSAARVDRHTTQSPGGGLRMSSMKRLHDILVT